MERMLVEWLVGISTLVWLIDFVVMWRVVYEAFHSRGLSQTLIRFGASMGAFSAALGLYYLAQWIVGWRAHHWTLILVCWFAATPVALLIAYLWWRYRSKDG